MTLAQKGGDSKSFRQELQLQKARFAINNRMVSEKSRQGEILKIGHIGKQQDILLLEKVMNNNNEPGTIKQIASTVLEVLKQKFPPL